MRDQSGFSLIEALVALVILAVSATALIGATEAYIGQVRGLEDRATAQWVAENALVELQLNPPAAAPEQHDVTMLDRSWTVRIAVNPTTDPDLLRVAISVGPSGSDETLIRFGGFVDRGGLP